MSGALASHRQELADGLAALGLAATPELLTQLLAFGELLLKWNKVYNLTAIREPAEVITHHLLDAFSALPWLDRPRTLFDIGSGAGLPGIVFALVCQDMTVYSVEAVGKKADFQRQAKIELKLDNLTVIQRRAEAIRPPELPGGGAQAVISRAFSSLAGFVQMAGHLAREDGALYAMKGGYPEAEIAALPAGWRIEDVRPLVVPGLAAKRHLLRIRRE
ncbi:MAG: 16S rRNA (guanine(527)-N(7))-methyltransferase RsmG [Azoarcus sp.]|jgi:16S rRNA (guanine527-N7)-methyltransferase|nr:16S rRNA (guanine(527)-N(7))-methyltransferase RsmG [Azoarcus sp.]